MKKILLAAIIAFRSCPVPAYAQTKEEFYLFAINHYQAEDDSPSAHNPYLDVSDRDKLRDGHEVCKRLDSGQTIHDVRLAENKTVTEMGDRS